MLCDLTHESCSNSEFPYRFLSFWEYLLFDLLRKNAFGEFQAGFVGVILPPWVWSIFLLECFICIWRMTHPSFLTFHSSSIAWDLFLIKKGRNNPKFFGFGKMKILACGITFSALEYPSYADKSKLSYSSQVMPTAGYMGFGFSFSSYIFIPFTQRW